MSTTIQRSFSGGELAPALYARVDVSKYQTGLRILRNFYVMRHGGASNRSGTEFVGEVSDSSKVVRLIEFVFNASQSYILEFGEYYMRVVQDGVHLTETAKTITGITAANPGVVTSNGHGYATGDEIYVSGVVGMTELNNRNFKVVYINANTFSMNYMDDSTVVDTSAFTAYSSAGTAEKIYQIATPYIEADLSTLQFVQSADVVTIVHPDYQPRELSRTGHTSWSLAVITFAPGMATPTNVVEDGAPGATFSWRVTSVAEETYEESLPSTNTVESATDAGTTVSWDAMTGAAEYNVYKALNGIYGFIGVAGSNTFTDDEIDPDTTDTPPTARDPFDANDVVITGITAANPAVVTSNAHGYEDGDIVYILDVVGMTELNNRLFTVANKAANTFELSGEDSTLYTAYVSDGTAYLSGYYPSTVAYYQQRLVFANAENNPEKTWASRTGHYGNYTVSFPSQDDDAVTFTAAGRQVNAVQHLVDLGKLVLLTTAGEWTAEGDESGILKPTAVNLRQQSYNGSTSLAPVIIGKNAIHVQARGSIVRDVGVDLATDEFTGGDLTIFSAHLFDGYTISDWAFQQVPHSILWVVRSDGVLLGLTFVREHQMIAWHRHDFEGGTVQNVAVIPEGNADVVYVTVTRTINGETKKYIERFSQRRVDDIVDAKFMDSYLTYDGRNTGARTMTLSGGSDWLYTETLTLTASTAYFSAAEVGNQIHLTGSDGGLIRFSITGYTSTTVVTGKAHKTVPASLQATATATWTRAVDELTGLWHIEGEDVSVFGDGFVAASPNNSSYTTVTVTDGAITLDKPFGVIHVGLPYYSDLETLDIDKPDGETLANKAKLVSTVDMFVESSRGIWVGPQPPSDDDDDPIEGLTEMKLRNDENYNEPVSLKTGVIDLAIEGHWNSNGRVFVRQIDPIPLALLAIVPSGLFPLEG